MKKNRTVIIIIGIIVLIGAVTAGCFAYIVPKEVVADSSPLVTLTSTYEDIEQIYTRDFQDQVKAELGNLAQSKEYSFTSPLVVENPYGTNTTGLYIYFTTDDPARISYEVTAVGYPTFQRKLYNGEEDNLAISHEYMLIGMVPGCENTVTISMYNGNDRYMGSYQFNYTAPELLNKESTIKAQVESGDSSAEPTEGLYTVMGNDVEGDGKIPYSALYDNYGINRAEIPVINFRNHEMIFDDTSMYFSISAKAMAKMDRTGYVERIYNMGAFTLHHDYVFGSRDDLVMLASSDDANTKDDRIVSLNLQTGDVTEIIDLGDLQPDFKAITRESDDADRWDWAHINSVAMMDEDSIVISCRDTSTIMRIDNIYDNPVTNYMIGSPAFWAGTGYEDQLLERVGEFSLQGGQHSVLYAPDDSLEEGQYYLLLYNNNNTYSFARKDYDWSQDPYYYDVGIAADSKGNPSYYYKYLVDENARTFSLVDSIPIDYSGFVSSVQQMDNNLIVESGATMATYEFDSEGEMIQKLNFTGDKWIYRTKKYTYNNYWFVQ